MEKSSRDIAYAVRQRVRITTCDGPGSAPVAEDMRREALLLLSSTQTEDAWRRVIHEYPVAFGSLYGILGGSVMHREDLLARGHEAALEDAFGLGLAGAVLISSGLRNRSPAVLENEEEEGDEPRPIAHHLLSLPTIAPTRPDGPLGSGRRWQGSVRISYQFGEFDVPYDVEVVSASAAGSELRITLQEDEIVSEGENCYLVATPSGDWDVDLPADGFIPVRGAGQIQLVFRGICADGVDVVGFDALDSRVVFRWESIPAHFDDERIDASLWKQGLEGDDWTLA